MSRPPLETSNAAAERICLICERIAAIGQGSNPYFVAELETGYVVLGDFQYWRGYTLFLCKRHCLDLHDLEPVFRAAFLREMSEVAAAVHRAFRPHHLNYELLGNSEPHLHWHLFPRYEDEPADQRHKPVCSVDKALRYGDAARPTPEALAQMRKRLRAELGEVPGFQIRPHRHLGAYGVCANDGKALLVRKTRGPYLGLFDLPGGGIEFGEEPEEALRREFQEETGLTIATAVLRCVESTRVRHIAEDGVDEELHHVGLIYDVSLDSTIGSLPTPKSVPDGEDSGGAVWHSLSRLDTQMLTPFARRTLRIGTGHSKSAVSRP